jgi:hypothetical protein
MPQTGNLKLKNMKRKMIVTIALAGIISICIAAIQPEKAASGEFKNLKVLPDSIGSKQLSKIMVDVFGDELGVSCNFCHTENKETHRPDYASDEKPEKEIARAMMRMTIGINTTYFEQQRPMIGDSMLAVTCGTCHHGQPHPENTGNQ